MALTPEQEAQFDEVEARIAEIKQTVYDSLSIQNVGGSIIFNQAVALEPKLAALRTSLTEGE